MNENHESLSIVYPPSFLNKLEREGDYFSSILAHMDGYVRSSSGEKGKILYFLRRI